LIRSDFPQFAKKIPLFAVDSKGEAVQIAMVYPQADGGFCVELKYSADAQSPCLLGESGTGWYEDLPWFLDDLRPQGFLGKKIVQELTKSGDYPPDPRYWRSSHLLCFLLEHGADLPGNLLLGEQAVESFYTLRWQKAVQEQYAKAARDILIGPVYGSSAGGEQPKFTAFINNNHVIVKFSPKGDSPAAQRWKDLLVAEHLALCLLAETGIAVADSIILHDQDRIFLESRRFDRVALQGRKAAVSLRAVDAEFAGVGQNWAQVAAVLLAENRLDPASAEQMAFLWTFGQWIGNDDMHLGNLSLAPADSFLSARFSLCPVYDMLPMLYAPIRDELVERPWRPPAVYEDNKKTWLQSGRAAARFWQRVIQDDRISKPFKDIAVARMREIESLLVADFRAKSPR
jgi:hypothetical protein